jgi:hypothetical protein
MPGQARRYASCRHAGTPHVGLRRHVSHLHPAKIAAANAHIAAQRGQRAANAKATAAGGSRSSGSQPRAIHRNRRRGRATGSDDVGIASGTVAILGPNRESDNRGVPF